MKKLSLKERQLELKINYITEVARDLFFEKGYENTTIDEIAQIAGISKSTLYTYLKSKEEIFMYIHLEGMRQRYAILNEKMKQAQSGFEKIHTFGKEYYHFYKNNPGLFRMHMYEDYNSLDRSKINEALSQEFDSLLNDMIHLVREAFQTGINDNSLKTTVNVGYLDKYLAYSLRIMLNVAISPEKIKQIKDIFDEERFYFQFLDLFMKAISQR